MTNYPPWQPWPPPQHSPEIERRLTEAATHLTYHREIIDDLDDDHSKTKKRLAIHEKLILAIIAGLQVVLQDKYPSVAQFIKQILQ